MLALLVGVAVATWGMAAPRTGVRTFPVMDGHPAAGDPGNPVVSTAPIEAFVWLGPISLTKDQIDVEAIHWATRSIPVQAWVPWNDGIYRLVQFGEAIAWTPDAVRVQWPIDHSDVAVWVWANAVQRHRPAG